MRLIDTTKMQIPMEMVQDVCGCYMMRVEDVQRLITQQPTAYDIDKVVEELEEHAIEFESFGQCSDYVELSHAIEIVKAGGKNDD